jgi:tRNA modification GTPase
VSETIYALSSGLPPAGIAVIRLSGAGAADVIRALAGALPPPRRANYRQFRDSADNSPIDDGLLLWFPGPNTATGEDLAEFHLHGGRAVVAAMLAALSRLPGLREAKPGEFTRRAFENGRIDLAQAEGLADLLSAETEMQRKAALALAEGGLSQRVEDWRAALLQASALVEAELDFSDEGDVEESHDSPATGILKRMVDELAAMLANPPAERLRDGIRVVLAGPPNAGKSSLFNVIVGREAAIVTEIAGTTRDRIEAPVVLDGIAFLFTDTAGLRDPGDDAIEAIGMTRTGEALSEADIILWLGAPDDVPEGALLIAAKADLAPNGTPQLGLPVSTMTGEGLASLRAEVHARAVALLPVPGSLALNARHRAQLAEVLAAVAGAMEQADLLIMAEQLRFARKSLDALTGRAGVEDMLDTLFGRFCVGK